MPSPCCIFLLSIPVSLFPLSPYLLPFDVSDSSQEMCSSDHLLWQKGAALREANLMQLNVALFQIPALPHHLPSPFGHVVALYKLHRFLTSQPFLPAADQKVSQRTRPMSCQLEQLNLKCVYTKMQ